MTPISHFDARQERLGEVVGWIARCCHELGIPQAASLRLQLVAEELFLNAVEHGYRGGPGARIGLGLRREGGELRLLFEDAAPPFDPCAAPSRAIFAEAVETRPPGGFGCLLVNGLARETCYERSAGRNLTVVTLALD